VTRRTALPAFVAVAALALAACSGGSDSSAPDVGRSGRSTSSSSSSAPQSPPVVDGVTLTAPGSRLKLGETARVSWKPDQRTTGVIAVKVTGLLKMPIGTFDDWRLDRATRRSTPYFVHAAVRNLGNSDLSRVAVPLYLLDQRETLLQARRFLAQFTPCPSRPLPAKFGRGDKASVCLVYFAPHHGKLVAISFRPTEDFDPITWEGRVVSGGARQHTKTKR
jgi:hypothetical protein